MDIYIGGSEHSILHLLYARFIGKFLTSQKLISLPKGEPFTRLITQGLVLGPTYKDTQGHYMKKEAVKESDVNFVWEKMSKSKGNGSSPSEYIQEYGIDAVRLYILSRGNAGDDVKWDPKGIMGMSRWLTKLDQLLERYSSSLQSESKQNETKDGINDIKQDLDKKVFNTLQNTNKSIETLDFHIAISSLMDLTHRFMELKQLNQSNLSYFIATCQIMSIFAPEWSQKALSRLWKFKTLWPNEKDYECQDIQEKLKCFFMVSNMLIFDDF